MTFGASDGAKDDTSYSRPSDQSSITVARHSVQTGVTKQTIPSSPAPSHTSILSPTGISRRRTPNSPALRLKTFKPKADAPPPLDFGAAGLVGRDKVISTLKSCYDILTKDKKKELVLVAGESGVGKSSVIRNMESLISVEGLFVEGKFSMNTSNEPYSGVAEAFGMICQKIKKEKPEIVADLRQEFIKELGDKPGLLLQLIPELRDLIAVEAADSGIHRQSGRNRRRS